MISYVVFRIVFYYLNKTESYTCVGAQKCKIAKLCKKKSYTSTCMYFPLTMIKKFSLGLKGERLINLLSEIVHISMPKEDK